MIDIVLLILPILACSCIGAWVDLYQKRNKELFDNALDYCTELLDNVQTRKLDLATFNGIFLQNTGVVFADVLSGKNVVFATPTQKKQLKTFFDGVAHSDSATLTKHLLAWQLRFKRVASSFKNTSPNLYLKLGVLFGALVSILLI